MGSEMCIRDRDTTIPVNAKLAATDRSIHFVRITIICPIAKRISGEVSLNTDARLVGVIKAGNLLAIIPSTMAIARSKSASREAIRRLKLHTP